MKERGLFFLLVFLHLAPFWAVTAVPTTDGPSHVYNAWILRQQVSGREAATFRRDYRIDHSPLPNWTGHAALALLMVPFDPATAEKILASGCAVVFLLGARYLAMSTDRKNGIDRSWLAFLAFPFVYNQPFQYGFYNFCGSVGLFLFALGFWWRRRDDPGPGLAVGLNLILLLCYFTHILSTVLALGGIGILWLATLRRATLKRHLLHVLILAPQAILPLWFLSTHGAEPTPWKGQPWVLFQYLVRNRVLYTFSETQLLLGPLLTALFALLVVATLLQRHPPRLREEDGFVVIALIVVVLFFAGPEGMSGGSLIKMRLCLYPWLLLLPWISPRLAWPGGRADRPIRGALVAVLSAAAAVNVVAYVRWYQAADRDVQSFLSVFEGAAGQEIAPGSRVLPALFDRRASIGVVGLLGHAIDRAAVEKGFLDWGHYEAQYDLFPVQYRPGVPYPSLWKLEVAPADLDVETHRDQIDYVFCWKMPPGSPLAARLRRGYTLVAEQAPARLYRRMGLTAASASRP
jgi:hypothetical protein